MVSFVTSAAFPFSPSHCHRHDIDDLTHPKRMKLSLSDHLGGKIPKMMIPNDEISAHPHSLSPLFARSLALLCCSHFCSCCSLLSAFDDEAWNGCLGQTVGLRPDGRRSVSAHRCTLHCGSLSLCPLLSLSFFPSLSV